MNRETPNATIGDSSADAFADELRRGVSLKIGPFVARIATGSKRLMPALYELYRDHQRMDGTGLHSFHIRLDDRRSIPLVRKPLVRLTVDGQVPHEDMPAEQALAVLEWGMNLVIALRSHCYLMLHAAVVELDGHAMLLPADPGAGKTTLTAGLVLSGWRLFSDEFGLVRPGTSEMIPVPRPMALKNESIEVIRQFDSTATFGPEIPNTRKGNVAHLKPPTDSIRRSDEYAPVKWIAFPRWVPESPTTVTEIPKAEAFMRLASNAFNYELIGEPAFHTVAGLVSNARCFVFEYSNLDNAVTALADFVRRDDI